MKITRSRMEEMGKMPLFRLHRLLAVPFGNHFTKLLVFSMGSLFLIPATYKLGTYTLFRHYAIAVDGIITASSRGRDNGGRPFVEYRDLQGKSYE